MSDLILAMIFNSRIFNKKVTRNGQQPEAELLARYTHAHTPGRQTLLNDVIN